MKPEPIKCFSRACGPVFFLCLAKYPIAWDVGMVSWGAAMAARRTMETDKDNSSNSEGNSSYYGSQRDPLI